MASLQRRNYKNLGFGKLENCPPSPKYVLF